MAVFPAILSAQLPRILPPYGLGGGDGGGGYGRSAYFALNFSMTSSPLSLLPSQMYFVVAVVVPSSRAVRASELAAVVHSLYQDAALGSASSDPIPHALPFVLLRRPCERYSIEYSYVRVKNLRRIRLQWGSLSSRKGRVRIVGAAQMRLDALRGDWRLVICREVSRGRVGEGRCLVAVSSKVAAQWWCEVRTSGADRAVLQRSVSLSSESLLDLARCCVALDIEPQAECGPNVSLLCRRCAPVCR